MTIGVEIFGSPMTLLSFNDFDMAAVTNKVSDAKSDGLLADYDTSRKIQGVVSIAVENWRDRDGSFVIFEIHKVGKKRLIGYKVSWIVQLYTKESRDAKPQKHGCSFGNQQVNAVYEAQLDFMHGCLSVCDFQLAYSAAME
jgi:hypothetical protein